MAGIVTRKRPRPATMTRTLRKPSGERYLTNAQGKRVAVVLDIEEYRRLVGGKREPARAPSTLRESQASWDWIVAARDLRARAMPVVDSTPILRAIRQERARREPGSHS